MKGMNLMSKFDNIKPDIAPNALKVIEKLENAGYEAYIVGGCVRDYLMGKPPHDWDITTSALPKEIKKLFPRTIDTGIEHGTVTVMIGKEGFEVTTFRIDGEYKDNRHPEEVIFTDKLTGDLSRRDFTSNAIAYNPKRGFVDEFNGIDDIEKGIIRGVGNPAKRFEEDALRMMRALRFSAQLGFEIEEQTYSDLCANADLIKNISIERIRDEFTKLITSSHCERLDLLINSGMEKHFLPELTHIIEESNTKRLYSCLDNLPKDPIYRLSFLFRDIDGKTVSNILKRLRYDNKTAAKVSEIVKYLNFEVTDEYSGGKLLSLTDYSEEIFTLQDKMCQYYEKSTANIEIARKICDNISSNCHRISQLAINGADLQEIGLHGKDIGTALSAALDYILRNPNKNTKNHILTYLKEMTENEK